MTRYKPRHVERAYQRDLAAAKEKAAMNKPNAAKVPQHHAIYALLKDRYSYMLPAYQRGDLLEDDFLPRVRETFFGPFDYAAASWGGKFKKLTCKDIVHARDCTWNDLRTTFSSSTLDLARRLNGPVPPAPDEGAVAKLEELARAVPRMIIGQNVSMGREPGVPLEIESGATCETEIHVHRAYCPCKRGAALLSAHVRIVWAGYTIAREYCFPHQKETQTP